MFNDLSLQYPSNEAWAIQKKEKDGMPKKHDPKKREKKSENKIGHIKFQEKKEEIYTII